MSNPQNTLLAPTRATRYSSMRDNIFYKLPCPLCHQDVERSEPDTYCVLPPESVGAEMCLDLFVMRTASHLAKQKLAEHTATSAKRITVKNVESCENVIRIRFVNIGNPAHVTGFSTPIHDGIQANSKDHQLNGSKYVVVKSFSTHNIRDSLSKGPFTSVS
ncbi:hypothetical protein PRK78_001985 [Emydomyces testavorans]|uniref:Uncharacterized protein n=1 Tax=Emydomyces testavorans TaxID=2070801 RepID=A0AAF0DE80_9EURO|nr:hypothetical protein PRK78_001985 [Emydomyces testavorans]